MVFCCLFTSTGRRRDLQVGMLSEFKLSSKYLTSLNQPQHCMQAKAEAAWLLSSSQPKPVWWLQRKYASSKDQTDTQEPESHKCWLCGRSSHFIYSPSCKFPLLCTDARYSPEEAGKEHSLCLPPSFPNANTCADSDPLQSSKGNPDGAHCGFASVASWTQHQKQNGNLGDKREKCHTGAALRVRHPEAPRLCDVPYCHIAQVGIPCPELGFFQRFFRRTPKLELSVSSRSIQQSNIW